jgi:hypothetical protein
MDLHRNFGVQSCYRSYVLGLAVYASIRVRMSSISAINVMQLLAITNPVHADYYHLSVIFLYALLYNLYT